ncbi:hypothetical protein ZWY2020_028804 [Hordeum vulgare]|nr:hypothetical protein ZWY2020_028804 [Hordeum vulgare]
MYGPQPTSEYIHAGEGRSINPPRVGRTRIATKGESFDAEISASVGLEIVGGSKTCGGKLSEEQLFQSMRDNVSQLQALYRPRKEKLDSRAAIVEAADVSCASLAVVPEKC